jgi:hypothetical protein
MKKPSLRRLAVGGLILLAVCGLGAAVYMKELAEGITLARLAVCGLGAAVYMKELAEGITLASIVASGLIGFLKNDEEGENQ